MMCKFGIRSYLMTMEPLNLDLLKSMTESLNERDSVNEHLQNMLIDLMGGISEIDIDGCYSKVNDKYAATCGYVSDEMKGMPWTKTVHPDDLKDAMACYAEMVMNGRSELTFRGIKKDGSTFTKHIILISKKNDRNAIIGHYCFMNERF